MGGDRIMGAAFALMMLAAAFVGVCFGLAILRQAGLL